MRHHQPRYVDLPLPIHTDEPEWSRDRRGGRHRLLIIGLILLAIFLIGVAVTGGMG